MIARGRGVARAGGRIGIAALALAAGALSAQEFPSKPVRLVVPFPPGGPLDTAGRLLGRDLAERWGQSVVIDNKAGGTLGAEFLMRAPPDGYTLMIISSSPLVTFPHLQKSPYDVERSFVPVIQTAALTYVILANPASGLGSIEQLVEESRKAPGRINLAIGTIGSGQHLYAELFKLASGAVLTHVPYKGAGPALQGFLAGEVQTLIDVTSGAIPLVRTGKARALLVTGAKPVPPLPEAATFESLYPGQGIPTWHGIFAPAGTPRALVERIAADIARTVQSPAVVARFRELGLEPTTVSGEAFAETVRNDHQRWGEVIRRNKITVQ